MKLMEPRLRNLHRERLVLLTKASTERAALAAALVPIERAESVLDRVKEAFGWAMQRPLAVAAAVLGLVAIKPRVGVSWILRGLSAWRLFQEVRRRVPLERLSSLQR